MWPEGQVALNRNKILWLLLGSVFAMRLGAPEYFALGLMALGLISIGSKGETIKGLVMACLGLALSFIGQDPISGLTHRFSFGLAWMESDHV